MTIYESRKDDRIEHFFRVLNIHDYELGEVAVGDLPKDLAAAISQVRPGAQLSMKDVDSLVGSIRDHYPIPPIVVTGDSPPYTIIAGYHRTEACRILDKSGSIPCYWVPSDVDYTLLLTVAIWSNRGQGRDFSEGELKETALKLTGGGLTPTQVAEMLRLDSEQVARWVRAEFVRVRAVRVLTRSQMKSLKETHLLKLHQLVKGNYLPDDDLGVFLRLVADHYTPTRTDEMVRLLKEKRTAQERQDVIATEVTHYARPPAERREMKQIQRGLSSIVGSNGSLQVAASDIIAMGKSAEFLNRIDEAQTVLLNLTKALTP